MKYHKTADEIRSKLQRRIDEDSALLDALKSVRINTKHKTLTNRAIEGEGAKIGDYLGDKKALYVSYAIKYQDGHTRYASHDITAYTYHDENGQEIGTEGIMRISRTVTPAELAEAVQGNIDAVTDSIKQFKSEYRRAETIAKKHNALVDKINEFNDSLSYASEAQIN